MSGILLILARRHLAVFGQAELGGHARPKYLSGEALLTTAHNTHKYEWDSCECANPCCYLRDWSCFVKTASLSTARQGWRWCPSGWGSWSWSHSAPTATSPTPSTDSPTSCTSCQRTFAKFRSAQRCPYISPWWLHRFLIEKSLVGTFNKEKTLLETFSGLDM